MESKGQKKLKICLIIKSNTNKKIKPYSRVLEHFLNSMAPTRQL